MHRTKTLNPKILGNGVLALGLAAAPALVWAAAPAEESIIEQIIVTAQKRETALQDVPFSVAAPSGDQIRNSGASSLAEVGRLVPGLAIADLGPGQSQVAIRGISAGQVVRDQPGVKAQVGVYLDESPISVALFTPDLDLFDLQRFEVLRGPQGTLFGSGSISGVLRYITAQPQLAQFGGTAEVSATTGTDSEFGGAVKGMVNMPVGNTSAIRLVGFYDQLPGFIDSVYPGRGKKEDVNGGTKTGGRIAWLFQPTENFSITPRIVYQRLETDGYPRIASGRSHVLVRGLRRPVAATVSMDQLTCIVTDDVQVGDEVVLIGAQGNERVTPEELARHAETIGYEIVCATELAVRRGRRTYLVP